MPAQVLWITAGNSTPIKHPLQVSENVQFCTQVSTHLHALTQLANSEQSRPA
jgi:hypothetical protein